MKRALRAVALASIAAAAACNAIAGFAPAYPETCDDHLTDLDETDKDCGGATCPTRCALYQDCRIDGDCETGTCQSGSCIPASCRNGVRDGSESDVDCGGSACLGCEFGKRCDAATDCFVVICEQGKCADLDKACSDGIKNGSESDVDCGGACVSIGGVCDTGMQCGSEGDNCYSGVCMQNGKCE